MHDHSAAELPSLRRQKILLILERDGKVMASELSQHFAVSEDTIRRDLAELDNAGLVQRVHGGALPRPKDSGKDYFTRHDETDEVKIRLAQRAAQEDRGRADCAVRFGLDHVAGRALVACGYQHHGGDRFTDDGDCLVGIQGCESDSRWRPVEPANDGGGWA